MLRDVPSLFSPPLGRLTAVCPRCRRLVAADTACALDGSAVFPPRDLAARDRLVEAMWGTADEREALQRSVAQPVRARRLRDTLTGVATAAVVAFAKGGDAMVTLIAGLLGAVVGFAFGPGVGRRVLVPRDVAAMPSWPSVGIGRIVGAREIVAPGTTTRCAAWLIELRYEGDWGSRTTLRAGATAGFDVELDSGERVRVPAGAVWLAGRLAQFDGYNAVATATPLIRFIDPHGAQSPWPLFSFNIIAEQVVYAGDRVEVLGEVEPRPIAADPVPASGTASPGGDHVFRDAPPTMLFHRSLPVLGVVADKGKDSTAEAHPPAGGA